MLPDPAGNEVLQLNFRLPTDASWIYLQNGHSPMIDLDSHIINFSTGRPDFLMDWRLPGCSLSGCPASTLLQSPPLAFYVCVDPSYTKDMP